ncbi:LacI family DNA-binding transcriptional regulator [Dactylosporangium siamense]|uniref:LacI family DNA-binding transcriptional regulator n=1 Tax=Dactylosporangium siamense TaxID=685454 RepID=UPI0019450F6A|nr:LacI family DNA-binding transcriptional regulator [Dactylosporangium siamense]
MTEDAPGPHRPGRPGLVEVAARAGVSIKTASRALNGEGYVAHETRQRVQQAADELGYRANGMARELRLGGNTSTLIGMLGGDLGNPFYSKLASGLEREVRFRGLQLVTVNTDEDTRSEQRLTDALLERRVRALVVASTLPSHEHLAAEHRHGIPFVFVDRPPVGLSADAVLLDNRGGAHQAAAHLLELGHTRIGIVGDLSRLSTNQERVTSFGATLRAAGIADWREHLIEDAHDVDTAQRAVLDLLRRDPAPTAIFTTNNRITTGALRVLHRLPAPPALIGFDELDMGDILGVTVVTHDPENMGRQTARLLLERLDGYAGTARWVILPTRLIPRASSRRPPGTG